ncbi:MAG TPA: sigma-54-dependent Fis family transcriptional regulator [Planctomycetes bacterium]|nr:sigma-54-dependent Fis family transcriptional regulator [Planctomycetota bacterium]
MQILLAEDEPGIGLTLKDDLEEAGHQVLWAKTGSEALRALEEGWFDCLITDVRMPGADGIDLLKRAKAKRPETEVLVMTAYATVEQAVEAMREGAFDYFQKPFLNEVVLERIGQIERLRHLQDENERLRRNLDELPDALPNIIGSSAPMQDVFKLIRTVAPSDTSVLVEGESGTGKERVARAIHRLSPRRDKAFVAISCGALPETLLEDELFGHERGAFTDAARTRRGRFELAQGGTVFLDDIDDMSLPTQVKLLRVLQEREFERVGGEKTISVDLRVISATKVPLEELVRKGSFREDLFYRLKVVTIALPPLRERKGDLPLLVAHFIERYGKGQEYEVGTNDLAAMEAYDWPGNIRELENSIERAIALAGGKKKLRREHLLPTARSLVTPKGVEVDQEKRTLKEVLVEVEKQHLKLVLASVGGHRTNAAKVLGISRKVLWEKLKDYGIQ